MDKLKALWSWAVAGIRRLPIAQWIKPVWKGVLKEGVQRGGDELQAELNGLLEKHGDKALAKVNEKVDGLQARFSAVVDALPLPKAWEDRIKAALNSPVDALQERLAAGCGTGCAKKAREAFDAAFDAFQEQVKARIDRL